MKLYSPGTIFEASSAERSTGVVERSKEFYEYKKQFGSKLIKIEGVNIWLKADGFLLIGDIEKVNKTDYRYLWKKIRRMKVARLK